MSGATVKQQGDLFEDTFAELLDTLLVELGHTGVEVSLQPRGGGQRGKDVQARWRNGAGEQRFWHFELRSDEQTTLPLAKVGGPLVNAAASDHQIDVWCVAFAHAEPATDLDEAFAALPQKVGLRFALAFLTGRRGNLRRLYACVPRLHLKQYRAPAPTLTARERDAVLADFDAWLEEATARRPPTAPDGWTRVGPHATVLRPDSATDAGDYLRGLTGTCPWEAIAYDWAVPRPWAESRLRRIAEEASAGVGCGWLVSSVGEGRSSVLRRVAWQLAAADETVRVLWADGEPVAFPTAWVDALPAETRVLLCVDGSRHFGGLAQALAREAAWSAAGKRVTVLIADRGNQAFANRRRLLASSHARPETIQLGPLDADERASLVTRLHERDLLQGRTPAQALALLEEAVVEAGRRQPGRGRERPWLVPTVMRLTDPELRPFEEILGSALEEMEGDGQRDAVRVLLAIALVHAAGPSLPHDLALRLVGEEADRLETALSTIRSELEDHNLVAAGAGPLASALAYRTHGAVVSAGFVRAAVAAEPLRGRFLALCHDLPLTATREYNQQDRLRPDRFEILDTVADFLDDDLQDTEAVVRLVHSWLEFDGEAFAWWHRLGKAYTHGVQDALLYGREPSDPEALRGYAEAAIESFRTSLRTAEREQAREPRSTPYVGTDFAHHMRVVYHTWAFLESLLGRPGPRRIGGRDNSLRALYLTLLSIDDTRSFARSCTVLAHALLDLGELELSAAFVVAVVARGDDRGVAPVRGALKQRSVALPDDRDDLLAEAIAGVVDLLEAHGFEQLGVADSAARARALLQRALMGFAVSRPRDRALRAVAAGLAQRSRSPVA